MWGVGVRGCMCVWSCEDVWVVYVGLYSSGVRMGVWGTNNYTASADASVKSLKLYDMKQLTLAYLALLGTRSSSSSRSLYYIVQKVK